jgi:uncharacterized protein (TIGR00251 family)
MAHNSMKITVQVKPNARKETVTVREDGVYVVQVSAPPIEGKANERLIEVLSKHFHRPKRAIEILRGMHGRHKIVEIQ